MQSLANRVAEMRRFNRFYTQLIGVLDEGHLASPYSLAQVRVLYELAHHDAQTASSLCERLALDAGYSSRMLRDLQQRGLVSRRRSVEDGRQLQLELTARGKRVVADLDSKSQVAIETVLKRVPSSTQQTVTSAMQQIRVAFEPESPDGARVAEDAPAYVLRMHQPGDMGWIVHRHGVLYAQEYGWDERFEGLVAQITADFIAGFDPKRDRCWVAERDGVIVGSVFLIKKSKSVAQLRLLYVEPHARGFGIGARLVKECTRFAKQARYRKIMLWTNSVLGSARKIYEAEGYALVDEAPHSEFGTPLVGQTWELALS